MNTSDVLLNSFSPWELLCAVHCKLVYFWACLLIIWRASRFFAMLHGVDCPENMVAIPFLVRPSFEEFWRIWHASLNLWCLRYLYTPAGGRKNTAVTIPLTFLFIAYWHEGQGFLTIPQWYAWAALNAVGVTLQKAVAPKNDSPRAVRFLAAGIIAMTLVLANLPADLGSRSIPITRGLVSSWPILVYGFGMACVGDVDTEIEKHEKKERDINNKGSTAHTELIRSDHCLPPA
jgi:hypothetical protein